MKMFQTGFQCSAEGKLAPNVVPSPANGLCTAALLWPPEQARALSTEMLLPRRGRMKPLCAQREGRNAWLLAEGGTALLVGLCEYSVCWEQSRELQNVPLLSQCSYGGQTHGSQAMQAQFFLCPKSLTCELLYPTMTFSASQTDRAGLAVVQQGHYEAEASKAFFLFSANKINSVVWNNSCSALRVRV